MSFDSTCTEPGAPKGAEPVQVLLVDPTAHT